MGPVNLRLPGFLLLLLIMILILFAAAGLKRKIMSKIMIMSMNGVFRPRILSAMDFSPY